MSHRSESVMFVRAAALSTFPEAFQKYIFSFFRVQEICGVQFYVAFQALSLSSGQRASSGVAPCHMLNVDHFGRQNGMEENESLYAWIMEKAKESPQDIGYFRATWDDGCSGEALCE